MSAILAAICVLAATPEMSTDEALRVLGKNAVPAADLAEARRVIEQAGTVPEDADALVPALLQVWENPFSQYCAVDLAAGMAVDKHWPLFRDKVKEMTGRESDLCRDKARKFFWEPAMTLCRRFQDPRPVLEFCFDNEYPVGEFPITQDLRDEFLLRGIRRRTTLELGGGSAAAMYLSAEKTTQLLEILDEMPPMSDGYWMAVDSLAVLGDARLLPVIEKLLEKPPIDGLKWTGGYQKRLEVYKFKLTTQGRADEEATLLRAAAETDNVRLQGYAVWRAIYIGVGLDAVIGAVERNPRHDKGLLRFLQGRDLSDIPLMERFQYIHSEGMVDSLIFDPAEFLQYKKDWQDSRAGARDLLTKYEVRAIVERAREKQKKPG